MKNPNWRMFWGLTKYKTNLEIQLDLPSIAEEQKLPNFYFLIYFSHVLFFTALFIYFAVVQWHYKWWENAHFINLQHDVRFWKYTIQLKTKEPSMKWNQWRTCLQSCFPIWKQQIKNVINSFIYTHFKYLSWSAVSLMCGQTLKSILALWNSTSHFPDHVMHCRSFHIMYSRWPYSLCILSFLFRLLG